MGVIFLPSYSDDPEVKGPCLEGLPYRAVFYENLEKLGYIVTKHYSPPSNPHSWFERPNPDEISLTPLAYDYADYAAKSRLGRWWADLSYDVGHEEGLRARLVWHLVTIGLSVLASYLLGQTI